VHWGAASPVNGSSSSSSLCAFPLFLFSFFSCFLSLLLLLLFSVFFPFFLFLFCLFFYQFSPLYLSLFFSVLSFLSLFFSFCFSPPKLSKSVMPIPSTPFSPLIFIRGKKGREGYYPCLVITQGRVVGRSLGSGLRVACRAWILLFLGFWERKM